MALGCRKPLGFFILGGQIMTQCRNCQKWIAVSEGPCFVCPHCGEDIAETGVINSTSEHAEIIWLNE